MCLFALFSNKYIDSSHKDIFSGAFIYYELLLILTLVQESKLIYKIYFFQLKEGA